jgi:hypothetical protein
MREEVGDGHVLEGSVHGDPEEHMGTVMGLVTRNIIKQKANWDMEVGINREVHHRRWR